MPVDTAPELRFGVANEDLTGLAEALARGVRLKQRRRLRFGRDNYRLDWLL